MLQSLLDVHQLLRQDAIGRVSVPGAFPRESGPVGAAPSPVGGSQVDVDLEPVRRLRILVCRERRGHGGEQLTACETFASYTSPRLDGGTEVSGRMRLIREPTCRTSVRLQRIRSRVGRLGQDGVSE